MVATTENEFGQNGDARRLVIQADGGDRIDLPNSGARGGDILKADFHHVGNDLLIETTSGQDIVVKDYFAQSDAPDLVIGGNARLDGALVERLARPDGGLQFAENNVTQNDAGTQLAQAGDAIGKVESIDGTVTVQRADGSEATLAQGDPIYLRDVVQASGDGQIGIVFVDGTTFALSDGARMTMDEMVYDPATGGGNFVSSVLQGTFVFSTGTIAPNGNMDVNTPVGTIGIRGTTVAARIALEGSDTIIMLLKDADGHVGRVIIQNAGGIQEINQENAAVTITSFFIAPGQPVVLTGDEILQYFDEVLQQLRQLEGTGPAEEQGGAVEDPDAADQAALENFDPSQMSTAAGGDEQTGDGPDLSTDPLSDLLGFVPDPLQPVSFISVTLGGHVTTGGITFGSSPYQPGGISLDYLDPTGAPTGPTVPGGGSGFILFTGGAGNDVLDASEAGGASLITGDAGDDILTGSAFDDQINAQGGNDTIIGGHGGGNDIYDGGADIDTVKYESTDEGVIVDLTAGKAYGDKDIGVDTLINIENVVGGSGNDALIGNGQNNQLSGRAGADILTGLGGDDTLDGGESGHYGGAMGNDWIEDVDIAVFTGNAADYEIIVNEGGYVEVHDLRAGKDGTDTVYNMEVLRFKDQDVNVGDLENGLNRAPTDITLDANSVQENNSGAPIGFVSVTDPDDNDYHTFIVSDERFVVSEGQLMLRDGVVLDFESEPSIEITVTATDSGGISVTKNFTLNVTDNNDPPRNLIDVNDATNTVSENAKGGDLVGIVAQATDQDGDKITYSLSDDARGLFVINAETGAVSVKEGATLSYEESGGTYQITVRASSAGEQGTEETFTINVTNENDAPGEVTDLDDSGDHVAENAANGTQVGITAFAEDLDADDKVSYSLEDTFGGLFAIDAETGVITVADGSKLDYETTNSYDLKVIATDKAGETSSQNFTVDVTNVDEAPTAPVDINDAPNTIAETADWYSGTGITVKSTDPDDVQASITYEIVKDGIVDDLFVVNESGAIETAYGANFDFDSHPTYSVTVRATSNGLTSESTFVIDVNAAPTDVVDTDTGTNTVSKDATAGTTVGLTATGQDPESGETFTYSLDFDAGGIFQIDSQTGVVSVKDPDALADAGSTLNIVVRATDSAGQVISRGYDIAVTNGDGNEPPELINKTLKIAAEGSDVVDGTELLTTDVEASAEDIVYTLVDLPNTGVLWNGDLQLEVGSTFRQSDINAGNIRLVGAPNENTSDSFTVDISDGTNTLQDQVINIDITQFGTVLDGDVVEEETMIIGDTSYGRVDAVGETSNGTMQLILGNEATGNGVLRLNGAQVTFTVDPYGTIVGNAGKGHLMIQDGALFQSEGNGMVIAKEAGSVGQVDVDGGHAYSVENFVPSELNMTGEDNFITVGLDGTGKLNVTNGAVVSALNLIVGEGSGTGEVKVDGEGSLLSLSTDGGFSTASINAGGNAVIGNGDGSQGKLQIVHGGLVEIRSGYTGIDDALDNTVPGMTIARDQGSKGELLVSGSQSTLNIEGNPETVVDIEGVEEFLQGAYLTVGQMGEAHAVVTDGGSINVSGNEAYLGVGGGDFANPNEEYDPALPLSTLMISDGGKVTVTEALTGEDVTNRAGVYIGDMASGNGAVTVTGAGSSLEVYGTNTQIFVGHEGTGSLFVSGGAKVGTLQLNVGGDGGDGAVQVSGAGSEILVNNDYGQFGIGKEQYAGYASIGRGNGDSVKDNSGVLNILDGGAVRITQGLTTNKNTIEPTMAIGDNGTGDGKVNVIGTGSELQIGNLDSIGSSLLVGREGDGKLQIFSGGNATVRGQDNFISVAHEAGSTGEIYLLDGGTLNGTDMVVGRGGEGTLRISGAGSQVTLSSEYGHYSDDPQTDNNESKEGGFLRVGRDDGSDGQVLIQGGGRLLITNDGTTSAPSMDIGKYAGSKGTVSVDGTGSRLEIVETGNGGLLDWGPSLEIGEAGEAEMSVTAGGNVLVSGNMSEIIIGRDAGSDGNLTIRGAGSVVTSTGTDNFNSIGYNEGSKGALSIENGGAFEGLMLEVGRFGDGKVTVTGAGSKLTLSTEFGQYSDYDDTDWDDSKEAGFLRVGREAGSHGVLNVLAGGVVLVTNDDDTTGPGLQIGRFADSKGEVLVEGAGSTINIIQNHSTANLDWGPYLELGLQGEGQMVVKDGGTVNVQGVDAYMSLGSYTGGYGYMMITGANSSVNIIGEDDKGNLGSARVYIGQDDNGPNSVGAIDISNGGKLVVQDFEEGTYDIFVSAGSRLGVFGSTVEGNILVEGGRLEAGSGLATIKGDVGIGFEDAIFPSVLGIHVNGTDNGQHGTFNITGSLAMQSGIFEFNFVSGYAPQASDAFTFLTVTNNIDLGTYPYEMDWLSSVAIGVDKDFDFQVNDNGLSLEFEALKNSSANNYTVFKGGLQDDEYGGNYGHYANFSGGGGDDYLQSNIVTGGTGTHILNGGAGSDQMWGEENADDFYQATVNDNYYQVSNAGTRGTTDLIGNFDVAKDRITFDDLYDGEGGFTTGHQFTDGADFIRLDAGDTYDGVNAFGEDYDNGNPVFILEDLGNNKYNLIYDHNGSAEGYTIVGQIQTTGGAVTADNLAVTT